jgi:predicted SnoaL-like aldol condensation-catalyzing enzyme
MTTSNTTEVNKALVLAAITGVFVNRDPTVLDRLFSHDYRQHNPLIPDGTAAIKAVMANLAKDFKYEPGFVAAEGDLVMVHGRYTGWGRSRWSRWTSFELPTARWPSIGTSCRKRYPLHRARTVAACSPEWPDSTTAEMPTTPVVDFG